MVDYDDFFMCSKIAYLKFKNKFRHSLTRSDKD